VKETPPPVEFWQRRKKREKNVFGGEGYFHPKGKGRKGCRLQWASVRSEGVTESTIGVKSYFVEKRETAAGLPEMARRAD